MRSAEGSPFWPLALEQLGLFIKSVIAEPFECVSVMHSGLSTPRVPAVHGGQEASRPAFLSLLVWS